MTKSVDKRNKKNGGEGRKTGIRRVCWTFRASIAEDPSVEAQAEELCAKLADTCEKYAFQAEAAPTTGYKHFQGYFELNNKNRFEWIQNNIRKFEFLQERKGSPHQAWTYATKQETGLRRSTHLMKYGLIAANLSHVRWSIHIRKSMPNGKLQPCKSLPSM